MALTGNEVLQLSDALNLLNDGALQILATDLSVSLNELPAGTVKERAFKLVSILNDAMPPRDRELLEKLATHGNPAIKALATTLLRPKFVSRTSDPHNAVLLGKVAFIARDELRTALREFTNPSPATTRVLIVRGDRPGGKSYSFQFLRHLAFHAVNAQAMRVRASKIKTPRALFVEAMTLLGLNGNDLTILPDDPQFATVDVLLSTFKAGILKLPRRYWLVIDDLNEPASLPPVREAAFAMAQAVEEVRPNNLWLALLGYNEAIVDPELRHVARDDAEFPTPDLAADYVQTVADVSGVVLKAGRAREIVDLLFTKYAPVDNKPAMIDLTTQLERMADKLVQGQQP